MGHGGLGRYCKGTKDCNFFLGGEEIWDLSIGEGGTSQSVLDTWGVDAWSPVLTLLHLCLRHFQVGSYRYRSLIDGPYTL